MWAPFFNIISDKSTTLYAGDCAPPPDQCPPPDYYWNGFECVYTPGSPIIISLNRKSKYALSSARQGVQFDLDGDGVPEQISWTKRDSDVAFLALDRDGDGWISSGKELFGDHTLAGASNGFVALRMMAMATNGGVMRGSVSGADPLFSRLLLWTDADHNGLSEPWELRPASEVVSEIGLSYEPRQDKDRFGNRCLFRGWAHVRTAPGRNDARTAKEDQDRTVTIWDVWFTGLK
jgi:hypothetical protein